MKGKRTCIDSAAFVARAIIRLSLVSMENTGVTGLAALARRGPSCPEWTSFDEESRQVNGETFLAFLATLGHQPTLSDEELARVLDDSDGDFDERGLSVEAEAILFALDSIHHTAQVGSHGSVLRRTLYTRNAEIRKRHTLMTTLAAIYEALWDSRKRY